MLLFTTLVNMRYLNLVFVVLVCVQRAESQLNCHQCASKDKLDCLDPYIGPNMEDDYSDSCDDTDTHCSKYKIVSRLYDSGFILGKARETNTVTRGCIRAPGEKDGCRYIESDGGFLFVCICSSGDNCNGARSKVASGVTMATGLLLTAILRRFIS